MKKLLTLNNAAGFVAVLALIGLGAYLTFLAKVQLNLATFACWLGLDVVMIASFKKAGNKETGLVWGYTLGAAVVTLALCFTGSFQWRFWPETVTVTLCAVCTWAWWKAKGATAMWLCIATSVIAGVPSLMDAWAKVQPFDAFISAFWGTCAFCGVIQGLGVKERSVNTLAYPVINTAFNGTMFYLATV